MATVADRVTFQEVEAEDRSPSWFQKYILSTDHKIIGINYMWTSVLFFIIAGVLALLMRVNLAQPGSKFLSQTTYNEYYSMHGSMMVWMFAIPIVVGGFGNFLMPIMIGAGDVAFPRLNLASYLMFPPSGALLLLSFLWGAPQAGWTEYPPISLQGGFGTSLWCIAVAVAGISSTLSAINSIVTIINMRAPGMTLTRMPLFVWATFATAILTLVATPALATALGALFMQRTFGVPLFDPVKGGNPILWQHMFWFYSHPAVYIMILPPFGLISEIIPMFARKPIFGYKAIAFSSMAIAGLAFLVWAHHMFTSGIEAWTQIYFMLATMMIAVPTGIKIFSWVATLYGAKVRLETPMLFALGFISTFTMGGITGIMLAAVPVDLHEHATYFLVAHLHYVLFGGTVMGVFAGLHAYFPKMSGRMLDDTLGKWTFWLMYLSFNWTFLPMHWVGLLGMPRRVASYDPAFAGWNLFISIGSFVLGFSVLLFLINVTISLLRGRRAPANPWGGRTLDWATTSPPPHGNFAHPPVVTFSPYDYSKPLPWFGPGDGDSALADPAGKPPVVGYAMAGHH
ncbi:MAG: cytochrome c oxidase subunit I [Chloroflexota bacterium]